MRKMRNNQEVIYSKSRNWIHNLEKYRCEFLVSEKTLGFVFLKAAEIDCFLRGVLSSSPLLLSWQPLGTKHAPPEKRWPTLQGAGVRPNSNGNAAGRRMVGVCTHDICLTAETGMICEPNRLFAWLQKASLQTK